MEQILIETEQLSETNFPLSLCLHLYNEGMRICYFHLIST